MTSGVPAGVVPLGGAPEPEGPSEVPVDDPSHQPFYSMVFCVRDVWGFAVMRVGTGRNVRLETLLAFLLMLPSILFTPRPLRDFMAAVSSSRHSGRRLRWEAGFWGAREHAGGRREEGE